MKKIILFLFFASGSILSFAQHCPFDGGSAIVVCLKNPEGKIITDTTYQIFLTEIKNSRADSCSYAKGLLNIPFSSVQKSLVEKYSGSWTSWAAKRIQDCSFNKNGYSAVVIDQAETDCMVKNGNDFTYYPRLFEIRIFKNKILERVQSIKESDIYALCTNYGNWSRIIPLDIPIND